MEASTVNGIIAIIISAFSALFTGYIVYRNYFYKRFLIKITIAEANVFGNVLKINILYNNVGNQPTTITNSYIQLDSEANYNFSRKNHDVSCEWMNPFTLTEKGQKSITISYPLSFEEECDFNKIKLRINTMYIDSKCNMRTDRYNIGNLISSNYKYCSVSVEHIPHELSGDISLVTMQ